jgi:hypothetical protein
MDAITLQFVEGSGLGAGMIKWFGHGKYSHVDCVLPDGWLLGARSDRVGGAPPGVQVRQPDYVKKDKVERVVIPCTDQQQQEFYRSARSQLGLTYNKLGIVAFFFATGWTNPEQRFCSQLATMCLQDAGFLWKLSEVPNKIDPDDLRLIISAVWGV